MIERLEAMKKELNIIGLDCGHCALTLEKYLQKIEGVNECNVNFSTSKIFLDIDDMKYREVIKEIYKTTKQVNPSVKLSENKSNDNSLRLYDIILYIIGVIIGLVVLFVSMPNYLFYMSLIISALLMGYKTYLKAMLQLRYLKIITDTKELIFPIKNGVLTLNENFENNQSLKFDCFFCLNVLK